MIECRLATHARPQAAGSTLAPLPRPGVMA
jgi:hypothetical protein